MFSRIFLTIACTLGFLGIVLGAFGAHALESTLSPYSLQIYSKATQYLWIHAAALFGLGLWMKHGENVYQRFAGLFFILGIFLFSGSLYLLAMTYPNYRWLGAVTPLGGCCFLIAWGILIRVAAKIL